MKLNLPRLQILLRVAAWLVCCAVLTCSIHIPITAEMSASLAAQGRQMTADWMFYGTVLFYVVLTLYGTRLGYMHVTAVLSTAFPTAPLDPASGERGQE